MVRRSKDSSTSRSRVRATGVSDADKILLKLKDRSLAETFPKLAEEWDMNGPFTPQHFSHGSMYEANWRCKSCNFTWRSRIQTRTDSCLIKTGNPSCPACRGRVITQTNNLAFMHEDAAREFDTKLNDGLLAEDVIAKHQHVRYFFRCLKDIHHGTYRRSPYERTVLNRGCPRCREEEARKQNRSSSLAVKAPHIAELWNNEANTFTPYDVTPQSNRQAHFICPQGHKQFLRICDKVRRPNCSICMQKAATEIRQKHNRPSWKSVRVRAGKRKNKATGLST